MASEFELIERHFAGLAPAGAAVVRGVGDDCAILRPPPPGHELAVTIDTLVAGVHFPEDSAAADVGWKALASSLSDLAAAGAQPAWVTLALTLPRADADWVAAFARGFGALAREAGVALVGGDTTRGPLAVTVQAAGHVPAGTALGRDGARPGDGVWVSGWPGEAAAGLARVRAGNAAADDALVARLNRPAPRTALGIALRGVASACIDVSDGLAADLDHIAAASGVAAVLEPDRLPVSPHLQAAGAPGEVRAWILGGGDDYELCFSVPEEKESEINNLEDILQPLTRIGAIAAGDGLWARAADGATARMDATGYRHFGPPDPA